MAKLIAFRIFDPDKPSLQNDNWLRFDATRLCLDVEVAILDTPCVSAKAFVQTRRLVSEPYRTISESSTISISSSNLSFDFSTFPTFVEQERPDLRRTSGSFGDPTRISFRYRMRIALLSANGTELEEVIIPFAKDMLPIQLDYIHAFDPANPSPLPEDLGRQQLPNTLRAIGTEIKFYSDLTSVNCKVEIRDRKAFDTVLATQERMLTPNGNTTCLFLFDPLPRGVRANPTTFFRDYAVRVTFSSGSHSTTRLIEFGLLPKVPVGSLRIVNAGVSGWPLFDFVPSEFFISDTRPNLVFSTVIEAVGYDPAEEDPEDLAWISISAFDSTGDNPFFTFTDSLEFEGSVCTSFIQTDQIPPGTQEKTKRVVVTVQHGSRTATAEYKTVYDYAFRPDRALQVAAWRWKTPSGAPLTRAWLAGSPILVLDIVAGHDPRLSRIVLAVAVIPRSTQFYRLTPDSSRVVGFTTLQTQPQIPDDRYSVEVQLPGFPPEIFEYGSYTIYLSYLLRFDGQEHVGSSEMAEENFPAMTIARTPLARVASSSSGSGSVRPRPTPSYPPERLSGAHWCARFPDAGSVNSLEEPFRANLRAFISMLTANGATINIDATRRPRERAYLMHYAFYVSQRMIDPARVPSIPGVDIIWNHENAIAAATAMVATYRIRYEPALESLHTRGFAIDMNISGLPSRITANGRQFDIGTKPAHMNPKLWQVSSSLYSVVKLPRDHPHWSHTGH